MKKLIYLVLLFITTYANATDIVFTDIAFKQKLLLADNVNNIAKNNIGNSIKIDLDNNGEITIIEALAVYQLNVSSSTITNLSGIEYFTNLINLDCKINQLTTLDVSSLLTLSNLDCSANLLTTLYLKNGIVEAINFSGNNGLTYICADEIQVSSLLDSNGSALPNYLVNSFCTVAPGGNYNKITGQILFDNDNNTATTNFANPYLKLVTTINGNTIQTVSKSNGDYNFYLTQAGNYNLSPAIENPTWFTIAPISGTFSDTNNNISANNFYLAPIGVHQDVEISIRPVKEPVGGLLFTTVPYEIVFKNKGTQSHSGSLTMNFDNLLLLYQSSTLPVNIGIGSITHNYTNLLPFETRSFVLTLSTVNLLTTGSSLQSTISIDSAGETTPTQNDNNFTYNQRVVSNNNPNKVECLEGYTQPQSEIGKYLHYAINFENSGNQVAKNITIKTELDENKFDINSIQILKTTHPLDLEIINNKAYYKFRNANVGGPGGQGGILLKIKTNPTLPSGSTVIYGAEIFFDYEQNQSPTVSATNNANTTFGTLNVSINNHDNSIVVYPNPSNSYIYINSNINEIIRTVELYDSFGRLLQTNINNSEKASINISDRTRAIYFLKITTDNGQKVEKIIKN